MTIHTGVGCSYACAYCYIYDMGFPATPRPYPLGPLELVYALALNPHIVPGRTLAAFGSVTEPFLPETRTRAVEYMRSVWGLLKLPVQVSTKSLLTDDLVDELTSADPSMSVLVTVVTLRHRRLEPRAPDPVARLEAAGRAVKRGLKVSLFLRPLIPGLDDDARDIVRLAAELGVGTVVIGSLRVTESILLRLKSAGLDVDEILRRLGKPSPGRRQEAVRSSDLKESLAREAEGLGLRVFRAACEANTWGHGIRCSMCRMGPCNGELKPVSVGENEIRDLVEYLGTRARDVRVTDDSVYIRTRKRGGLSYLGYLVTAVTYRKTVIESAG